ncbi:MAG: ABC transporter permease [Paenibacillaceae bacterium]|nr:ABC transporter permease [Paenibacillaceae bacterium]
MVTVNGLFRRRVADFWRFQLAVARLVVDWTVALYVIVPALAAGVYQYAKLWRDDPAWMAHVPLALLIAVLYRFATAGTVRLFVEDGDQLFLLQRPVWQRGVMSRGIGYTAVMHGLLSIAAVALLAPLLYQHYGWPLVRIAALLLFLWPFRVAAALVVQLLSARFAGWRYWLRYALLQPVFALLFAPAAVGLSRWPLALVLAGLLAAALAVRLARVRLRLRGAFFQDADNERRQRLRLAGIVLRQFVEKKPRSRRKRPLLWRSSNRLFRKRTPANGLAEAIVKSFFRSRAQMGVLLRLLPLGVAALSLPFLPLWVKGVVWFGFALLLGYWLRSYWQEMARGEFVGMFRWRQADKHAAAQKAIGAMLLPVFLPMSAAIGISSLPWFGVFVTLAAGWALAWLVSHVMAPWG